MKKKKTKHKHPAKQKLHDRKIRLGYLSSNFGAGHMRDLLPSFFSAYNKLRFEVYAYHTGTGGDTAPFAKAVTLREVGDAAPEEAAKCIRMDEIDLLIDLSLRTPDEKNRAIMQLRPAPHIVSLAGDCPQELAMGLPTVEGTEIFPYCYTPFDPAAAYTYRTPLLDTGVPTIGVSGTLREDGAGALLQILSALLLRMRAVRLILPAAISEGFSKEDFARIAEMGTAESSLDLVDELPYGEIDLVLGVHMDLPDICRVVEHSVPLLVSEALIDDHYAGMLLTLLGLPIVQHIEDMGDRICEFCADVLRLSQFHELLRWHFTDAFDIAATVFSVERAYDRVLAQGSEQTAEKLAAQLSHAADAQDWDTVLRTAHALDGLEQLTLEQRMSLAWAYFFRDELTFAGRWALAAEGVSQEREGARLYLSVVSTSPPGTRIEIYERALHGLELIERGLSVVPDVHAALFKMCADHGAFVCDPETVFTYAMACSQRAPNIFLKRCYYGAALFTLNAVDISAQEVYEKSLHYRDFFADVQPYSHLGRRRKEKLRIGYISGDFNMHVMQYFIWPFLAGFDSSQFEVYVYNLGKSDQYSKFFQTLVTRWRDLSDRSRDMERIAREIYADEVDILFDLAGHTADSGLAALAWKPAPVQISGLGYMATTGLPAVDYFVTDHYCDPEGSGSENVYVEKLLRLTSQFCYNGYVSLPASEKTPAHTKGYIQFASFNQYRKLQDPMLAAWLEIMERIPNARLLLKNSAYGNRGVTAAAHARLQRMGFDMSRVMFEPATKDYMLRYLDVDIALDTFPWPGGGTTCDALYMGVPVVSYYTDRHSTRFTYSLLANMGLAELASDRLEDYVETAVALAGDIDLLDALHRELRPRMKASPVMDQERYIREMEECYRAIWAEWEARQGSV